jgi:hypothetical protein
MPIIKIDVKTDHLRQFPGEEEKLTPFLRVRPETS